MERWNRCSFVFRRENLPAAGKNEIQGHPIQVLTNRIVLSTEIENFPVDSGIYPSSHRGFI